MTDAQRAVPPSESLVQTVQRARRFRDAGDFHAVASVLAEIEAKADYLESALASQQARIAALELALEEAER